jgi:shikimate dehydrogenase
VGSAIAASLAAEGAGSIALYDTNDTSVESLAAWLSRHYPKLLVRVGSNDPAD